MQYLRSLLDVFLRYRYLIGNLVRRDISVKYRRSALGLLWSFLNPLLMMLIMTAVFSYMFRFQIEYFPVYLLSGQVVFNYFNESTSMAMESVLINAGLIKKVYVPKYIFPLEKVLFCLINALFSLVSLVIVIAVMRMPVTPWILLFPLPILLLFFFNLGIGTLLSSLVVFFRDIKHLYSVLTLALMYLTPIFYPEGELPVGMQFAIQFNPLYWYVAMFRQIVLYGSPPTAQQLLITSLWAFGALVAGIFVMKKTQDRFILYI